MYRKRISREGKSLFAKVSSKRMSPILNSDDKKDLFVLICSSVQKSTELSLEVGKP